MLSSVNQKLSRSPSPRCGQNDFRLMAMLETWENLFNIILNGSDQGKHEMFKVSKQE